MCSSCGDVLCAIHLWKVCDVWRLEVVLFVLEMPEGMRSVLLCMLDVPEAMRCMLL